MREDFSRLLSLLRRERGISQKKAAEHFGISQALLSHYENGVRECGLDFIVKAADFYSVSADYLLGRSPVPGGSVLTVADLPDESAAGKENTFRGSVLPTVNKRLIINSLHILFDILQSVNNKQLTAEASALLFQSVYTVFRLLYGMDRRGPAAMFSVEEGGYRDMAAADMLLASMRVAAMTGEGSNACPKAEYARESPLTPETLQRDYPLYAASLQNLIKQCEQRLKG